MGMSQAGLDFNGQVPSACCVTSGQQLPSLVSLPSSVEWAVCPVHPMIVCQV